MTRISFTKQAGSAIKPFLNLIGLVESLIGIKECSCQLQKRVQRCTWLLGLHGKTEIQPKNGTNNSKERTVWTVPLVNLFESTCVRSLCSVVLKQLGFMSRAFSTSPSLSLCRLFEAQISPCGSIHKLPFVWRSVT